MRFNYHPAFLAAAAPTAAVGSLLCAAAAIHVRRRCKSSICQEKADKKSS
jgi:hypothetical protein